MNERIKQLALQAVTRFDKDMDGSMEPEESGRWVQFEDLEKLAVLIVWECSRVAKLEVRTNSVCDAIEKHFGVEG